MTSKKLSEAETKHLIELYQAHDVLWNICSPNYKNLHHRDQAFKSLQMNMEIKFGLKIEVAALKTKLQSFRNCYSKEMAMLKQSYKSGAGTEEVYSPKYPYFRDLHFLQGVLRKRTSTSNLDDLNCSREDLASQSFTETSVTGDVGDDLNPQESKVNPHIDGTSVQEEELNTPLLPDQCGVDIQTIKSRNKTQKRKVETAELHILHNLTNSIKENKKENPLYLWGQHLISEMDQIKDSKKRKRLQIHISRLVQDAILEELD